jgi:hypothetical protein
LILLGLATAVRPTSLAAVCALLASSSPRRVLTAYVAAGAAFTITFGLLVIFAFQGVGVHHSDEHSLAVAEILVGCIFLGLGLLLLTGKIGEGDFGDGPPTPNRWLTLLNNRVTTRTAAIAGPVTHLPGICYVLALNLIISHQLRLHTRLLSLLVYNAIWFCVPVIALTICFVNPTLASDAIGAVEQWARSHRRAILLSATFGIGSALLIDGLQRT